MQVTRPSGLQAANNRDDVDLQHDDDDRDHNCGEHDYDDRNDDHGAYHDPNHVDDHSHIHGANDNCAAAADYDDDHATASSAHAAREHNGSDDLRDGVHLKHADRIGRRLEQHSDGVRLPVGSLRQRRSRMLRRRRGQQQDAAP
jgi:hypothetical protein